MSVEDSLHTNVNSILISYSCYFLFPFIIWIWLNKRFSLCVWIFLCLGSIIKNGNFFSIVVDCVQIYFCVRGLFDFGFFFNIFFFHLLKSIEIEIVDVFSTLRNHNQWPREGPDIEIERYLKGKYLRWKKRFFL